MRNDALAKVRSELECHECGKWVQFELDMNKEGNHIFNCPNCGHEHCRVVRNGRITSTRWAQRNKTFAATAYSYTASATNWSSTTASTGGSFGYYSNSSTWTTSY